MKIVDEFIQRIASNGVMLSLGDGIVDTFVSACLSEEKWITIGGKQEGDEKHVGGFKVKIDGEGNIVKGRMKGTNVKDVKAKFDEKKTGKKDMDTSKSLKTELLSINEWEKENPEPVFEKFKSSSGSQLGQNEIHLNDKRLKKKGLTEDEIKEFRKRAEEFNQKNREWSLAYDSAFSNSIEGRDLLEKNKEKQKMEHENFLKKNKERINGLKSALKFASNDDSGILKRNIDKFISGESNDIDFVYPIWKKIMIKFVKDELEKKGAKKIHQSESGSMYFLKKDGDKIRLSDHKLPMTDSRIASHDAGFKAAENEIVLDDIKSQSEIEEMIESALF